MTLQGPAPEHPAVVSAPDNAGSAERSEQSPPAEFAVQVEPAGIRIQVDRDESLMQAAVRQGHRWPTICHGQGECGVCFVRIRAGAEQLSPRTQVETELLGELRSTEKDPSPTRLACRLFVHGDGVVVFRPGVR